MFDPAAQQLERLKPIEYLKDLKFGGSGSFGVENNPHTPAVLRTSANASSVGIDSPSAYNSANVPFLAFNNNVRERGGRTLWELHATYFYKGLSLLAAWDSGRNDLALTSAQARPVHLPVSGYFAQIGYLVTGETLNRVTLVAPLKPLDFRRSSFGLGALELQARFSELEVGSQVFTAGLADGRQVIALASPSPVVATSIKWGQYGVPGFEAANADRLVRLFAKTVGSVVYPMECCFDLGDKFASARPSAQLDCALCFERSAVREIGFQQTFFLQVLQRIRRLGQQLGSPAQQFLPKIFDLKRVHEFFSIGGMVTWR